MYTDKKPRPVIYGIAKAVTAILAFTCLVQIAIGFLGLPSSLNTWIVCGNDEFPADPSHVVVLGGGGIPSESGLMRTYYAAELASEHDGLNFIVALPSDSSNPEEDSVGRMKAELIMRGVSTNAIMMETRGINTHQQAVNVRKMLGEEALKEPLIIVTSPTHMRRAVLCFRREGFQNVTSVAAHSTGAEADLGPGTSLRYAFWSRLGHSIEVCRELIALGVYRLKGWI